jgi:hypothetical protein
MVAKIFMIYLEFCNTLGMIVVARSSVVYPILPSPSGLVNNLGAVLDSFSICDT